MKIGVIINPKAKKIRTGNVDINSFKTFDKSIVQCEITKSTDDIDRIVNEFKKNGIRRIGVVGGDGTFHQVISSAIRLYKGKNLPSFLILKGGTMDNISRSIGLKGYALSILKRYEEAVKTSVDIEITSRDTIEINGRYCLLFGAGFVTNFLNEAYGGAEKGLKQNIKTIGKAIAHAVKDYGDLSMYRPLRAAVFVDGTEIPFKIITGMLSGTVEHIGMGFSPLLRGKESDGSQQAIITGTPPSFMLKNIFSLMIGKQIHHPLHFDSIVHRIKIKSHGPFQYTMDGDLYTADSGNLSVKMGPKIKLLKI